MRHFGIKLVIICLVLGCSEKPENLISEDEMVKIIVDLKIQEVKVDNFYLRNPDSSRIAYRYLKDKVFEKYKVDSASYDASYNYYLRKNEKLLDMLNAAEIALQDSAKIDQPQTKKGKNESGNRTNLQ